ncbi:MAG: O-methyltransferase [Flammeovirgaceae bacterium]|nr:O-methyltransferase [Flammeovirgaceae bacterium]MDW8287286.1 O-methyltransferase [Flammeovirgaceae bacterium]
MQFFITHPSVEEYIAQHASDELPILKKIDRETHLEVLMPQMISGHVQGMFLSMVSKMMRPKRILEIGTFTGYSAICLAQGLDEKGLLYTIEINEELEKRLLAYFKEAGLEKKIRLIIGDALTVIPTLRETFDLVFIDADKKNYISYFDSVVPLVRSGGFILVDNVLWKGKILDATANDKDTLAIRDFNERVNLDPRVRSLIVPMRDGLMLIEKL